MSLPIPALVNPHAGGAEKVRDTLGRDSRFVARDIAPATIADAVRAHARDGASRLLVCGGDGTVAAALGASVGTALEIAIFPSGTLNHFAHDLGLPAEDPAALLDIAATGTVMPVDLGYVNGHVILNTSSIGSYVDFVRHRDSARRWLGYRLASLIAAVRVWLRPRSVVVDVHTDDGTHRTFKTPLVFVGVDERKLDRTGLGARLAGGAVSSTSSSSTSGLRRDSARSPLERSSAASRNSFATTASTPISSGMQASSCATRPEPSPWTAS